MNMRKKVFKKGFTLVELLVVIAVIGILASIAAPNAFKAIEKSKVSAVESDYKAIKMGTLSYYSDCGTWPANNSASTGFVTSPSPIVAGWNGPYIEKWPEVNAFGGIYEYHCNAAVSAVGISATDKYLKITGVSDTGILKLKNDFDSTTLSAISLQNTGSVRYQDNAVVYILLAN